MPRIPYRYPAQGVDPIADAIRERRGARGLTPLDGMLLNSPPVAQGWNTLLGAIRTKGILPDDVREIMILRVAARNRAAFEWIHHEHVATHAGVTPAQLRVIGDLRKPLTASSVARLASDTAGEDRLSRLQAAALVYADSMTANVNVPEAIWNELKSAVEETSKGSESADAKAEVERKMVEATATTAVYNMVSRFLVALNIDNRKDQPVPVPGLPSSAEAALLSYPTAGVSSLPASLVPTSDGTRLATRVQFRSASARWIVCVNSLLTDMSMWSAVLPALSEKHNVLLYDQRGHGASEVPKEDCTIERLADDIADLISHFELGGKVSAVIGVSQGGATALSFGIRHAQLSDRIVACDTQPTTPAANVKAWDDRITLAEGDGGMARLAEATVPRWFGEGTDLEDGWRAALDSMVARTSWDGFRKGARALQRSDLGSAGLKPTYTKPGGPRLLLVAGEKDGAIPTSLGKLRDQLDGAEGRKTKLEVIPAAGHLPMCDQPERWAQVVSAFLDEA